MFVQPFHAGKWDLRLHVRSSCLFIFFFHWQSELREVWPFWHACANFNVNVMSKVWWPVTHFSLSRRNPFWFILLLLTCSCRSFAHSFVHSCVHVFVHSCIRAFMHYSVRAFVRSCVSLFVHAFVCLFMETHQNGWHAASRACTSHFELARRACL
jgi:Na+/melibiose symporter-like transporter